MDISQMHLNRVQALALTSIMASLYAVLTIILAPISYGPIQLRIADALLPFPYLLGWPMAIALFAGCLVANIWGFGIIDMIFGSLLNLAAGLLVSNRKTCPHWILSWLYPTLIIGLGVPSYLAAFFGEPYWVEALRIMASTAIVTALGVAVMHGVAKALTALTPQTSQTTPNPESE